MDAHAGSSFLPSTPGRSRNASTGPSSVARSCLDSPSHLSSSDIGEKEESWAAGQGEDYWRKASVSMETLLEREDMVEEQLASPTVLEQEALDVLMEDDAERTPNPVPLSPPSLTSAPCPAPSSPVASTSRLSPEKLPSPVPSTRQQSYSPMPSIPFHSPLPSRSPSPVRRPARNQISDSPSPSPEPVPEYVQEEPEVGLHLQGRSLRTRTAAQLKPYSIENFKYQRELLKNGWRGAVVAGPRVVEESAEELRRKKRAVESRPKDDLGGWLEYEEGQAVSREHERRMAEDSDEDHIDGETLLERQARRRERMDKELLAAFNERGKGKEKARTDGGSREEGRDMEGTRYHKSKSGSRARRLDSDHSSDSNSDATRLSTRPIKTKSRKGSTSHRRPKGSTASDGGQRPKKVPRRAPRGDSEPPPSSPTSQGPHQFTAAKRRTKTSSKSKSRAKDAPSRAPPDRWADMNRQIMELSSASSVESQSGKSQSGSSEESASDDDDEEESPEVDRIAKTKLGGKRKRALGMMMPAVFMKKAQADLKLMEQEKLDGVDSGSDLGSGDEERLEKQNRAKRRMEPRLREEPFIFDGATFTDESASDGVVELSSDEEDEENAVDNWLHAFKPRGHDSAGYDIIDRFLKNAKAPSKGKRNKTKRGVSKQPGVVSSKKDSRDPKGKRGGKETSAETMAKRKDVAVHRRPPLQERDSARNSVPLDRLSPVAVIGRRTEEQQKEIQAVERWATYDRFSHDFQISPLPTGVQFTTDSFVKKGHLFSLVSLPSDTPQARSCSAFDLDLRTDMPPSKVGAALPQLCDCAFDGITTIVESKPEGIVKFDTNTATALGFIGYYITDHMSKFDHSESAEFAALAKSQLKRLEDRLDHYIAKLDDTSPDFAAFSTVLTLQRVSLSWYILDIGTRLSQYESFSEAETLPELVRVLIGRLLRYGVERTTKTLKKLQEDDSQDAPPAVNDASVDVWLGLISLALSPSVTFFAEEDLWATVEREVFTFALKGRAEQGPVAGEAAAYTAILLCAISQFSSTGYSGAHPRLSQHWSIIQRSIDIIKPAALSQVEHEASNSALAKRDRYLWIIPARCLVLCQRWNWKLSPSDTILPSLFDLLKARHLADLTIESNGDFPTFLQDVASFSNATRYVKGDTAFNIFLKLVNSVAAIIPEADYRRLVARLFLRLSPMNSTPWIRTSAQLSRGMSALTNHYSLYMTFTNLLPSSALARLQQARSLLSFADAAENGRQICIRAVLYFGMIFRQHNLAISPVVEWLAAIASQLRLELDELQKQERKSNMAQGKKNTTEIWNRTVLLTMVLRSAQLLLRWKRGPGDSVAYPDVQLLNEAWTSQILTSTLALDPMLGLEVINFITSFLDLRHAALPNRTEEDENGTSQDEFGIGAFDYDDPDLNQMLGVEVTAKKVEGLEELDRMTAKSINATLLPAFFAMVSNIFVARASERDGPTIANRGQYAQDVVECWFRCIAVTVDHKESDWIGYLQYGRHSWKRIPDLIGRRDIGLLLVVNILLYRDSVFDQGPCRDEILEVWFQSIVAKNLTVQHKLLSILLNARNPSPLLLSLPLERDGNSGLYDISKELLENRRVSILKRVFTNSAKCFSPNVLATDGLPSKPKMLNLIRGMLTSMKDNLASSTNGQREYAEFCRPVLAGLEACGPDVNHISCVELPKLLKSTALSM